MIDDRSVLINEYDNCNFVALHRLKDYIRCNVFLASKIEVLKRDLKIRLKKVKLIFKLSILKVIVPVTSFCKNDISQIVLFA